MASLRQVLGRIFAVGLLLIAVLIVLGLASELVVHPYLDKVERIEEQRKTLGKLITVSELQAGIASQDPKNVLEMSRENFLAGATNAEAVAALQAKISEVAVANGSEFRSASVLEEVKISSLKLLGVGVQLTGSQDAIFRTLYLLENQKPFLFIDNGVLETDSAGVDVTQQTEPKLTVNLEIYGAIWDETAP